MGKAEKGREDEEENDGIDPVDRVDGVDGGGADCGGQFDAGAGVVVASAMDTTSGIRTRQITLLGDILSMPPIRMETPRIATTWWHGSWPSTASLLARRQTLSLSCSP